MRILRQGIFRKLLFFIFSNNFVKDYLKIKVFIALALILSGGFVFLKFMRSEKTNIRMILINSVNEEQGENEAQVSEEIKTETKILFVGDMMFDRYIRQAESKNGNGFVFEKVKNLLSGEDLVVGNLEGPVTDNVSKSVGTEFGSKENYIFTFNPKIVQTLFQENIRLVNIGNNHILNFKESGVEQTKKYLDESDIKYFGNVGHDERNTGIEINEITVGFVNYNQFAQIDVAQTIKSIEEMKKRSNLVIVYAHWGVEYEKNASQKEKELAHQFVDAGADLVIGSHPHVVQEKEEYKGKMIYYSLGNFIFDQYFNPDATQGLTVEAIISPKNFKIDFRDIKLTLQNNGQTKIAD
jgi:poly-gamma-glutamate synthesis protein (capsule biosynthesis protein)